MQTGGVQNKTGELAENSFSLVSYFHSEFIYSGVLIAVVGNSTNSAQTPN